MVKSCAALGRLFPRALNFWASRLLEASSAHLNPGRNAKPLCSESPAFNSASPRPESCLVSHRNPQTEKRYAEPSPAAESKDRRPGVLSWELTRTL